MLVPSSTWQPMIQSMDLNRLCSVILEKTIADPDMYQNGLTKIFFRAGMLAALESMRSERLNAMVTVVQKNMRRKMAMNNYRKLRAATIKIQTWWRGILARRLVLYMKKEVQARRLQCAIRRHVQRKQFLDIRRSVVLVQSRKCIAYSHLTFRSRRYQASVVLRRVRDSVTKGVEMPPRFFRVCFVECMLSYLSYRLFDLTI